MTFTDDDLKRLKETHRGMTDMEFSESFGADKIDALLSRMEAAEAVMKDYVEHGVLQCVPCMKRIEAWRKVCGK